MSSPSCCGLTTATRAPQGAAVPRKRRGYNPYVKSQSTVIIRQSTRGSVGCVDVHLISCNPSHGWWLCCLPLEWPYESIDLQRFLSAGCSFFLSFPYALDFFSCCWCFRVLLCVVVRGYHLQDDHGLEFKRSFCMTLETVGSIEECYSLIWCVQ